MKKKLTVFLAIALLVLSPLCCMYKLYTQEMNNMQIMLRVSSRGDIAGSDYIREYLLIVLPESQFHGERTMDAVGLYLWTFNRREPDSVEIVFYDSQEEYENQESYYSVSAVK